MSPERWQQVTELFHVALEREPAQRAAFLEAACAGDEELLREVASLIRSHQQNGGLIDLPVLEKVAEVLADEVSEFAIGQSIGHYKILKSLGAGGMGKVYLAQDHLLDRKVAIKVLPVSLSNDRPLRARFIREAQLASALDHPNICTIHEIGESAGRHFIVMQYVEGDTLKQLIGKRPLSLDSLLSISLQVADALTAAHSQGIIHRDIKSSNIIITPRGQAKVLDFGLAKLIEDSEGGSRSGLTQTGAMLGTPSYMSPEQARGEHVDHRSDIFSFGVVMYEMATGRAAFKGKSQAETMNAVINEPHQPVAELNKDVPPQLSAVIDRALAKETRDRYQSMTEVEEKLRQMAQSGGMTGSGVPYISPRRDGFLRRLWPVNRLTLRLALAVFLIAVAAIVYSIILVYERRNVPQQPPQRSLSRLTFDVGLQSEPTWSPDGRFIAYSSDKSGNFDIWVQPVGGGDGVQVTKSLAHDWQPDWSPDGTHIVFRSERDGGGLFVVPALGGRERKISSFGYQPRWSPDGTKILFSILEGPGITSKVYVVTLDGNLPREVLSELLADFVNLRLVIWHPDGQRISLWGERRNLGYGFWTVPLAGGTAVKSELDAEVERQFKEQFKENLFSTLNFRWAPSGRAVYFNGYSRAVINLWRVTVDPQTLRWVAGPERLTTGFKDTDFALSPDGSRLAFTVRNESTRAWSLPFDARAGKVKGEGQPVTPIGRLPAYLNLSRDSKHLLYVTDLPGTEKWELRQKSLADNRETLLTVGDTRTIGTPCWSRDGTRFVSLRRRSASSREESFIVVQPAGGGNEQVIASGADDVIFDWSADGQWILATTDRQSPRRWGLLCLYPLSAAPHAETQMRVITSHPEYNLFQARFSPDDRWVCFEAVKAGNVATIYVVPTSGGEWLRITEDNAWSDKPHWSPDGKTIYFLSNRVTGFYNVWGIRFDPEQGEPVGEPFRVTSFDSPGKKMWPDLGDGSEITLSPDRLVLPITEVTGSIWVLDGVDR